MCPTSTSNRSITLIEYRYIYTTSLHEFNNKYYSACMDTRSDVTFLLDSSGSIGNDNWMILKKFVIGVIDSMDLANDMTRVAVIRYSTKVYLYIIDLLSNQYESMLLLYNTEVNASLHVSLVLNVHFVYDIQLILAREHIMQVSHHTDETNNSYLDMDFHLGGSGECIMLHLLYVIG